MADSERAAGERRAPNPEAGAIGCPRNAALGRSAAPAPILLSIKVGDASSDDRRIVSDEEAR